MGDDEYDDDEEAEELEWDMEQAILESISGLPPRVALAYHIVNYGYGMDKRLINRSTDLVMRYIMGEMDG